MSTFYNEINTQTQPNLTFINQELSQNYFEIFHILTNNFQLAPENGDIKIKDTINVPGARALKLEMKDEHSAKRMKEVVKNLQNQWTTFCPALDIGPGVTRIKLYVNGDCPDTYLKDKAALQVLLNGTLGKFSVLKFWMY